MESTVVLETATKLETVDLAWQAAQDLLKSFATEGDYDAKMQGIFGDRLDGEKARVLAASWAAGDFSAFPAIEVRDSAEINGARGAFAQATGKIYLSRELVNAGDAGAIGSVLLEEYGHYIDAQVNYEDALGDEGALFAAWVEGQPLNESDILTLKAEDDSAVVVLDGQEVKIEQANSNIQVTITAPPATRPNRIGEVTVTYTNVGQTDTAAPLLTLSANGALLQSPNEGGFTEEQVEFLGINNQGAAGILPPGASGSFKLSFLATGQANEEIKFSAGIAEENTPIDWNVIKNDARPDNVTADAWDVIWNNFTGSVGNTAGQYQAVLADNATHLSQLGDYSNDVSRLLAFELEQSGNYGSIPQRYDMSSLGRGWAFSFEITATEDIDGNVTVKSYGISRFFRKQADGSYLNQPGDEATLTKVENAFQIREQGGNLVVFRPDGKFDFIEDVNNNRITATYTGNQLTSINSTNGDNLSFSYNPQGRISQVVDQAGRSTTYSYDPTGELLLSITEPQGTTSYTYNAAKALTSVNFPDATQILYDYDAQGRVIKQSLNGGAEAITFEYDSAGGVTASDATGAKTKLLLNDLGQIGHLQDSLGRNLQFKYNADGNLNQQITPGNISSNFTYDEQGNLLNQVDPLGNSVNFTYDLTFNQVQSISDQRGNVTAYKYDDKGNLVEIEYVPSSDEQLNYPVGNLNGLVSNRNFGRLNSLTNSTDTNPTVSYYDKNGELITSKLAYTNESIKEQFNYDIQGNVVKYVNRRGQVIEYTYDDRERLIKQTNPDGSQINFTYDNRDNLISATDAKGTITQEFDSADRLTKITYPNGRFLQYTYDAGGRRTRMVDRDGFAVNYAYDSVGRLAGLTDDNGQKIVSYTYDSVGRLSREDNGNGTYTTYGYDTAGQLLNIINYAPNASVNSRFDYTYDQLGRRTSMTTLEGSYKYSYDANSQLISVTLPDNRTIQYQYDGAGNRSAVTDNGVATSYETNNLNQYTFTGQAQYNYDADGNLISKIDGNQSWTYTYDAENRLIGAVTPEGSWSYEYDAFGNRIASTQNGQRTEYLLDPTGLGNVVGEYSNGSLVARYTHGLGLKSRVDTTNGTAYYDFDGIGSTAGLTAENGSYVNRYNYLPFGEDLNKVEVVSNPFEYVGQFGVMDEGNGLDFMRARYYIPSEGRFINPDPIGQAGGVNLYNYVQNAPINFVDLTGKGLTSIRQGGGSSLLGGGGGSRLFGGGGGSSLFGRGGGGGFPPKGGPQVPKTPNNKLTTDTYTPGGGNPVESNPPGLFTPGGPFGQQNNLTSNLQELGKKALEFYPPQEIAIDVGLAVLAGLEPTPLGEIALSARVGPKLAKLFKLLTGPGRKALEKTLNGLGLFSLFGPFLNQPAPAEANTKILPPPPPHPEDGGTTFNDPRIVTFDKQYHDFQAAGEFTLVQSTSGDLKIQVRQEPVGNNPQSNVSDNTAVATVLGGKRIGIYLDRGLLVDGVPTEIADLDSLAVGDGRIYREGSTYTVVYPTGDQLVAKVKPTRVNIDVFLTDEREGQITGLLGNFNNNPKDDLIKGDGTVLNQPVSPSQLYGEYADSWRLSQAESLFDYEPGTDTNNFTIKNFPPRKITLSELRESRPADVEKAEQRIGNLIADPTIREATIVDYILTGFDETIIEDAIASQIPNSALAIAIPPKATDDSAYTTANTPVNIEVLLNDTGTIGVPLAISNFDATTTAGGTLQRDNNNTPDDTSDDKLTYTPPVNFTGTDSFNYTLTDGTETDTAKVTITVPEFNLSTLNGGNGFVLKDTEAGSFSGVSVSKIGDFNGDNIDDLIVGAFAADPNGSNAAGKSFVVFGTTAGFPADFDLSTLNGSNGFVLNGIDAESFSGGSVSSAGDINNDGFDDVIVGAFGAAVDGKNNAGKTYILFGSNAGFSALNLSELNGSNGFVLNGTNEFDYLGLAVSSAGDINDDGFDDILIGVPGAAGGGSGKTYILFGRSQGFAPSLNLTEINGDNGFVINNAAANAGISVSKAGDINSDGIADLIIGTEADPNSANTAGESYVVFGSSDKFPANLNLSELNGSNGFILNGIDKNSGTSVSSAGDINGDGIDDLMVAENAENALGKNYIVFGSNKGFSASLDLSKLDGKNGFLVFNGIDGNAITSVNTAGDMNGDGIDDIALGVSASTVNDKFAAGKTYIMFGNNGGFPAAINLSKLDGSNGFVLNGAEAEDLSGTSVSEAGDINNDGTDDLVIGSPGSLFNNTPGKSYAVFGSNNFGNDSSNLAKILFNPGFYLKTNPDVAAAVESGETRSASEHFNQFGFEEGRVPSAIFADYLNQNPDVAAAVNRGDISNGFEHFIKYGFAEGRLPNSEFSLLETFYLAQNPDVAESVKQGTFASGLEHLIRVGLAEGRNPLPSFNAISQTFNAEEYLAQNPDVAEAVNQGIFRNGFEHFVKFGLGEGRDPSSTFSNSVYLASYPDVAEAVNQGQFRNGFDHFMKAGFSEDRSGQGFSFAGFDGTFGAFEAFNIPEVDTNNDPLTGSTENDILTGDAANNILNGELTNDPLTGDSNSNVFALQPGGENNVIAEFEDGIDFMGLANGVTFEQLAITPGDGATLINLNGQPLASLTGVEASNISREDFILI